MNLIQLKKLKHMVKPYYLRTGKYHDWQHVVRVEKLCLWLSSANPKANKNILLAGCYLHDTGRVKNDEGHAETSVLIAKKILRKIKVKPHDIERIIDVVNSHDISQIKYAKTLEAKILFDADKLEIGTVSGFLRTVFWLSDERKMEIREAVAYYWENLSGNWEKYVQTEKARKVFLKQIPVINKFVNEFSKWEKHFS